MRRLKKFHMVQYPAAGREGLASCCGLKDGPPPVAGPGTRGSWYPPKLLRAISRPLVTQTGTKFPYLFAAMHDNKHLC